MCAQKLINLTVAEPFYTFVPNVILGTVTCVLPYGETV